MTKKTTRRDVLKAAGTVSSMSGFSLTATASEGRRVRVVEAGIRYDVPSNDNYDIVMPDSRPPFTIDNTKRRLLVLNTATPSTRSRIQETTDLFAERSPDTAGDVTISPRDRTVTALPTELSGRMRVKEAVGLVSPIKVPEVTLHANANAPTLNIESEGIIELPVGESTEVRLDSVVAEAHTTHVVGRASIEGVPDYMQGLIREEDSVEIDATPIVEAINHGKLTVERQPAPPK